MTTFATTTATHGFPGSFGHADKKVPGRQTAGSQGRFAAWLARFAGRAQQRLEAHALDTVMKQLPRIDPRVQADVQRAAARSRSRYA